MATLKTCPYEILLRFNCERGEQFGHLRGCHRVMATYVVDDNGAISGRVDSVETAADFPPDELSKYLGEQFAAFEAQLVTAREARKAALAKHDEISAKLADLEHSHRALAEEHGLLKDSMGKVKRQLAEAKADNDA